VTTYLGQVRLTVMNCMTCGIVFGVPEAFDLQRREKGGSWVCPNGHSLVYREPDVRRLERERDQARARARHEADQREATQRSLSATRGALTKVKKRVGNGTCPCCNRHFQQLKRHMATRHPDYVS
jgi:hypothetical protein